MAYPDRFGFDVREGETALFGVTLRDETGAPLPLAALATLTLTLTDRASRQTVNGRSAQSVLNAAGGTMASSSGLFTWEVGALDTEFVTEGAVRAVHVGRLRAVTSGGRVRNFYIEIRITAAD